MPLRIERRQYAEMFGPTVGDQIRLGDTDLLIEVERDLIAENGGYGNEIKFGGGKVIRDGMGQSPKAADDEALDLIITNATILDAKTGILKADIGIKGGRIIGIGTVGIEPGIQVSDIRTHEAPQIGVGECIGHSYFGSIAGDKWCQEFYTVLIITSGIRQIPGRIVGRCTIALGINS